MTNRPGSWRLSAAGSVGIGTRSETFPAVHTTSSLRGSSACRSATRWRVVGARLGCGWPGWGETRGPWWCGAGGRARLLVGGAGEKWTEDCRCDVYARSGPVESIFSTRARRVRRIRRARRARHARRAGPAGPLRDGWGGWSVQDLPGQALDLQARAVVAQPGRIALGPGGVRGEGGQVEVGEDPRAQELRQGEGTVRGVPARSRAAAR